MTFFSLVSDNDTKFASFYVVELCENFGIINKFIFNVHHKKMASRVSQEGHTNWHKEEFIKRKWHIGIWAEEFALRFVVLPHHSSSSIEVTPYKLVYGEDAIIPPVDINVPMWRIKRSTRMIITSC